MTVIWPMEDAELNFEQCSFLSKCHILLIFCFQLATFYTLIKIKIPRFIRVEYISIIQNGGFKIADVSSSFVSNEWRHHDIIAIVKDHLCISQLPWLYQRPY